MKQNEVVPWTFKLWLPHTSMSPETQRPGSTLTNNSHFRKPWNSTLRKSERAVIASYMEWHNEAIARPAPSSRMLEDKQHTGIQTSTLAGEAADTWAHSSCRTKHLWLGPLTLPKQDSHLLATGNPQARRGATVLPISPSWYRYVTVAAMTLGGRWDKQLPRPPLWHWRWSLPMWLTVLRGSQSHHGTSLSAEQEDPTSTAAFY